MGRRRERLVGGGGGAAREGPAGVAGGWSCRFEPDQGFTAGHNSMCGDCVEGLASTAAAGPSAGVCVRLSLFWRSFFSLLFFLSLLPLPLACGLLDVFVLGAKVNWRRNKERRKTLAWQRSCVTSPSYRRPAMFKFSFFLLLSFPLLFSFRSFFCFVLSSLCHAWI